jgi:hypothetical protein
MCFSYLQSKNELVKFKDIVTNGDAHMIEYRKSGRELTVSQYIVLAETDHTNA